MVLFKEETVEVSEFRSDDVGEIGNLLNLINSILLKFRHYYV